jgi:hypothetical protein
MFIEYAQYVILMAKVKTVMLTEERVPPTAIYWLHLQALF